MFSLTITKGKFSINFCMRPRHIIISSIFFLFLLNTLLELFGLFDAPTNELEVQKFASRSTAFNLPLCARPRLVAGRVLPSLRINSLSRWQMPMGPVAVAAHTAAPANAAMLTPLPPGSPSAPALRAAVNLLLGLDRGLLLAALALLPVKRTLPSAEVASTSIVMLRAIQTLVNAPTRARKVVITVAGRA